MVLDEAVLKRPIGADAVMRAQLERLVEAATEPHIRVRVLPFEQGGHDALGGSLTVLTLPDGSEVAYTEGAHYGQLVEETAEVRHFSGIYDRVRADALPTVMSLDVIRSAMEGYYREANVPSRSERRRLTQEQLQQSGGRRLRGGRRRIHGRRARS